MLRPHGSAVQCMQRPRKAAMRVECSKPQGPPVAAHLPPRLPGCLLPPRSTRSRCVLTVWERWSWTPEMSACRE